MLSNHSRLGENGVHVTSTVDQRTLYLLDLLKDRVKKNFNLTYSAGAVIRRAVEDLYERSESWQDITPFNKDPERRRLETCKKARPAPDSPSLAAQERYSEAGE